MSCTATIGPGRSKRGTDPGGDAGGSGGVRWLAELSAPGSGLVITCSLPRVPGFQIAQRITWQHAAPTSKALSTVIRSQPSRARGRRRRGSLLPKPQLLLREEVSCYGTERTAPEVLLQRSAALCLANNSPGSQTGLSPTSPRTSGVCSAAQTHRPAQYAVSKAGSRSGVFSTPLPHERGQCDHQ